MGGRRTNGISATLAYTTEKTLTWRRHSLRICCVTSGFGLLLACRDLLRGHSASSPPRSPPQASAAHLLVFHLSPVHAPTLTSEYMSSAPASGPKPPALPVDPPVQSSAPRDADFPALVRRSARTAAGRLACMAGAYGSATPQVEPRSAHAASARSPCSCERLARGLHGWGVCHAAGSAPALGLRGWGVNVYAAKNKHTSAHAPTRYS